MRKALYALTALLIAAHSYGASTINTAVPAANSQMQSAPIRANFLAAYNDITALQASIAAVTAGTSGGIPYYSSATTLASSGALTANALVIGGGAGSAPSVTSTASGILTWIGTPSSANLATALTDETGSGAAVFANSPTLVTPALGTPSALTLTNATGLPVSTGISGLGSDVATFLATPSSANLRAALTDESGTGAVLFAGGDLGTPSAAVLTNATGTASGLTAGAATALAANPTDCGVGEFANAIAANGDLTCAAPTAAGSQTTGDCANSPTITGSVSDPTISYTTQSCKYVKTAKTVTNTVTITINTASGGSGSTQITNGISDTPTGFDGGCSIGQVTALSLSSAYSAISLSIQAGSTTLFLYGNNFSGGTQGRITSANFANAGQSITYTCTYQIP